MLDNIGMSTLCLVHRTYKNSCLVSTQMNDLREALTQLVTAQVHCQQILSYLSCLDSLVTVQIHCQQILVSLGFLFGLPLKTLKHVYQRNVSIPYKGCFVLHPRSGPSVGPPPNPPPFGAQRPYWHTVSCLPPLGNSLLAGTQSGVRLRYLLAYHLVSTPFGEQPPHWHIVWCQALIPFITAQIHSYQILSFLSFPSRL